MRLISEALSLEDSDTVLHSRKVSTLITGIQESILRIVEKEQLEEKEGFINTLQTGGIIHDIGKVKIPKEILNKKGKLSKFEYTIVKRHTVYGIELVNKVSMSNNIDRLIVSNMVLFHHERWDGTGYPYGLSGSSIPIEARITSVIDTYEAIRAKRPYKEAKSHEYALEEIERCKGSQFDPKVVNMFIQAEKLFNELYAI